MINIDSAFNSIDKRKKCTIIKNMINAGLNIKIRIYGLEIILKNAIRWVGVKINLDLNNGAAVTIGANKLSLTNTIGGGANFCFCS